MPGNLLAKERAIVTLTTTGASITSGSAGIANATANFDGRAAGNAPDDFQAQFEFICKWTTVPAVGAIAAELYLLPLLDGTNAPDIDLTAVASRLPYAAFVGTFEIAVLPVTATDMRFISPLVTFNPLLFRPYILNRSLQTMTANWTLKAVSVQAQYT